MKRATKILLLLFLTAFSVLVIQVFALSIIGVDTIGYINRRIEAYYEKRETKQALKKEEEYDLRYIDHLNSLGIFENEVDEAIPQTSVYQMIMNHFQQSSDEERLRKKAIILGYDGCRTDAISTMMNNDNSALALVKEQGAIFASYAGGNKGDNVQKTVTGSGWVSMLTGAWADFHGVFDNECSKNNYETFMTKLSKQEIKSCFIARWRPLFTKILVPDIEQSIVESLPVEYNYVIDDQEIYYSLLKEVVGNKSEKEADIIFGIFEDIDSTGHSYGYGSDEYLKSCKATDTLALEIIKTIYSRETLESEDWLIIITTDHGGYYKSHGNQSNLERITWIATNKPL